MCIFMKTPPPQLNMITNYATISLFVDRVKTHVFNVQTDRANDHGEIVKKRH